MARGIKPPVVDATDQGKAVGDRRDATQRIRIGLTGLAGVLVLVLLAAAMLGLRSSDGAGSLGPGNGSHVAPGSQSRVDAPKDPLAELGVTPGGSTEPTPSPASGPLAPSTAVIPPAATPGASRPPSQH